MTSSQRYSTFESHISRATDLIGLGQSLSGLTQGRVDGTEMYRSALVVAVASLDSYIHGAVLDLAVDVILGRTEPGNGDRKFGLALPAVRAIAAADTEADRELVAKTYVAERISLETYQFPDDIAKALAMVGVAKIWSRAFNARTEEVRQNLSLVVRRRNAIVHQCDSSAVDPATTTPMLDTDALSSISTIRVTLEGIHAILAQP